MSKNYDIKKKVWGTHGLTDYEFEPGEVTPKNASEALILEHLVEIGRAEVVAEAKPPKKKET